MATNNKSVRSPKKPKSTARKIVKVIGIIFAVPIVLVALVLVFLHTSPGQNLVRKRIVDRVAQRLNGTITVGSLEFALFGDLALRDVVLADENGEKVVGLDTLEVSPEWGSLFEGNPVVESVAIDGVSLNLVQNEDGTSNLKNLFKPKPAEPPKEPTEKKRDRRIRVDSLHIGTVNVAIHKPDGTVIELKDFGLDATIDMVPTTRTAKVVVPNITAGFSLKKEKQGLFVDVAEISTGVEIDVTNGAGKIELAQTSAKAKIQQKGAPERNIDLELGGITLDVQPGEVNAMLEGLAVGALALQSLEVTGRIGEGGLDGKQHVQLVGLEIDHTKLNELLGKEVLASDIGLETTISGPPEEVVLSTAITTEGGRIEVGGDVDISDLGEPTFDVTLSGTDLRTAKLLEGDKVPPVVVESLRVGLKGHGRSKEGAEIDLGLHVANVKVKNHVVDELRLDARFDGGELEIRPLTIEAYGTKLVATGKVDLPRKLIDVTLTIEGDVGATLDRLRAAGLKIKTKLPRGALRLRQDVVTVRVYGDLEGLLDADVIIDHLAVAGGAIVADFHAKLFRNIEAGPNDKKVELRDLDGTLELLNINLKQALALRGKKLEGLTGTLSAKIEVEDVPKEPLAKYHVWVKAQPSDKIRLDRHKPMLAAHAWGHATKRDAWLHLDVDGMEEKEKTEIMKVFAHAPLLISDDYKGIAPYRQLRIKLDMPERRVHDLLAFVPPKLLKDKKTGQPRKIPDGKLFAHIDIGGTGAAPNGDIDLDVHVPVLGNKVQRVKIDGDVATQRQRVAITTGLEVWIDAGQDKAVTGEAKVELSKSPLLPGPKAVSWSLDLDVLPQVLSSLPLPPEKLAGVGGTASAGIHLKGNKQDVTGKVDVKVDGLVARGKGPFNVGLGVTIQEKEIVVDVDAGAGKSTLVKVDGSVARGGKGLIPALRDKTPGKSTADKLGNPKIDVTIELPDQSTAAYAAISPILHEIPGKLGGKIQVGGDLKTPIADGTIAYHDFKNVNGGPGRLQIGVAVSTSTIGATVDFGHPKTVGSEKIAPVAIGVTVPRAKIKPYSDAKKCHAAKADERAPQDDGESDEVACAEDAKLPITAKIAADDVDIKDLIPGFAMSSKKVAFDGRLTWTLDAHVVLDPKPRYAPDGSKKSLISPESKLAGSLRIHDGIFTIPGTKRQYEDILVAITHNMQEVRVESIRLRESDLEKPERKLDLRAHLGLNEFKPGKLTVHLAARDWLVFGSDRVGPADAPRASLSTDIRVNGNLGRPIKKIDVDVQALEVLIPDRFDRAHQPEVVHKGDVIYLKRGMTPGKLPVPLVALDAEAEDPFADEKVAKEKKPQGPETGLDVNVRIPNKAHILQFPMNLYAVGGLKIKRRGKKRTINGKLDMVDGDLSLGGKKHALVKGHFLFNEECSGGCMDLLFARKEHPSALRDVSSASAGDTVNIHLQGPLSARVTTLSGAGSPGTLFDLLSMHNAGRPRYVSQPDLPATAATEYPQHFNLLMLSYFSVNVPHLLFLDRIAAWSDAYDGRGTGSYGQYRHYRAEGYYADDTFRVRGEMRPPGAGQSEAELGFEYLFSNTPQTAVGVGVNVGSRGGGGPGIFLEWSSKD